MANQKITDLDAYTDPLDADLVEIVDMTATPTNKKLTWANIKATLKTYFDTLYDAIGSASAVASDLSDHEADTANPHSVTAVQAGADPAGSASAVASDLSDHEADTANPHSVTKTQVGLSAVTNDAQVKASGNQTVAGIKTFSSFPVTPSSAPTTDYQTANKKYVDDQSGGGGFTTLARAYVYNAQTLNNSTYYYVDFSNTSFDVDGDFDTTNQKFIAPADGYYRVDSNLRFSSGFSGAVHIFLRKNGSANLVQKSYNDVDSDLRPISLSDVVYLEEDDYIQIRVIQISGSSQEIAGSTLWSWFTIQRVG